MEVYLVIILAIGSAIGIEAANKTGIYDVKHIVCPVNTKSVYNSDKIQFNIENVDLNLCTMLIGFDKYWHEAKDPWHVTDENRDSDYLQLTGLRTKFPHLKVLLGIRRNNRIYMDISNDGTVRSEFVKNATDFVTKYDFDGIDLRWNQWTTGDNPRTLKPLLGELHKKLNESSRLLIASCDLGNGAEMDEVDVALFYRVSDFIALFHSYPNARGVNEAFLVRNISYIENHIKTITGYTSTLFAELHFLIGISFESPEFITTISNGQSKLSRWLDYNDVCELPLNGNGQKWTKSFDNITDLTVAKSKTVEPGEEHTVVFESSRSVANKLRISLYFGGVMISALHRDDVRGKCGFETDTWDDFKPKDGSMLNIPKRNETSFTLLRTMNEAMEIRTNKKPSSSTYNTVNLVALFGGILTFFFVYSNELIK